MMRMAADCMGTVAGVILGAVVVVTAPILAPVVSAVALPVFAIKAIFDWSRYQSLCDRAVQDLTRVQFGRVSGQDYTRST